MVLSRGFTSPFSALQGRAPSIFPVVRNTRASPRVSFSPGSQTWFSLLDGWYGSPAAPPTAAPSFFESETAGVHVRPALSLGAFFLAFA